MAGAGGAPLVLKPEIVHCLGLVLGTGLNNAVHSATILGRKLKLTFLRLSYDSNCIQQRAMYLSWQASSPIAAYRRLAGKAYEKCLVEVHAASCPATSLMSIARMP